MKWKEYNETSPREAIPVELQDFLKYAQEQYREHDNVNWTYFEDQDERTEEVKHYISDSSEAILMFIEYQERAR